MSDSVYISKNLNLVHLEFIKRLDEFEIDIFNSDEIETILDIRFANMNEILENLVHKGLLSRIERGKFCKVNFRNEHVIGSFLTPDATIAYWSALNLHGLTEQFANRVFIQTYHRKNDKTVFGVNYKFIKVAPSKMKGIVQEGHGTHVYRITNIEKTIVDCFDLPQYSGGYVELIRAFVTAGLSGEEMREYCKAIHNIAATKRMGYLAELFGKKRMKTFIRFAQAQVKEAYNLLDPMGPATGPFNAKWRLRVNIPEEELKNIAFQPM